MASFAVLVWCGMVCVGDGDGALEEVDGLLL